MKIYSLLSIQKSMYKMSPTRPMPRYAKEGYIGLGLGKPRPEPNTKSHVKSKQ